MIVIHKNRIGLFAAVVLWMVIVYIGLAASFNNLIGVTTKYSDGVLYLALLAVCVLYLLVKSKGKYPTLLVFCFLLMVVQIMGLYLANTSGFAIISLRTSVWAMGAITLHKYLTEHADARDYFLKLYILGLIFLCGYTVWQCNHIRTVVGYIGGMNELYWVLFAAPILFLIKEKALRYIAITEVCIMTLYSLKLTAIAALLAGLIVYAMVNGRLRGKSGRAGMLVLIAVLLLWIFFPQINDYLLGKIGIDWGDKLLRADSTGGSGRLEIWEAVWNQQERSNLLQWIFGHGYYQTFYDVGASAHNDFLEVLYDFGLLGLVVYLAIYAYLLQRIKYLERIRSPYAPVLAMSLVMFFVTSLFSHFVIVPGLLGNVAAVWAVCCLDEQETRTNVESK